MNKSYLFLLAIIISSNLTAQTTIIPDVNFEQKLINLGVDTILDGVVLTANIDTLTTLNVSSSGIGNLTGLEDFTSLIELKCNNNNLNVINVTQNTALKELTCNNCLLTNLNVTQNPDLTYLNCWANQITSLDLSQNTGLLFLTCSNNQLTSLNISQNLNLTSLACAYNNIDTLDVSNHLALDYMYIGNNPLTCKLDLTNNNVLTSFSCRSTPLTTLSIKNGNNINMTYYSTISSSNLTCIEVDDAAYSTLNWTNVSYATTFSENCHTSLSYTIIPDSNFEQELINLGVDNIIDGVVPTFHIDTLNNLNISNKNISDLTGIQDFSALINLNCDSNSLTNLNLVQNTALSNLSCKNNQLISLNLNNNIALTDLNCSNNLLTSLDVTQNAFLTNLYCRNNQLSSLNVDNNSILVYLDVSDNSITTLGITLNGNISGLDCQNNLLTCLNVENGNNSSFTNFNALNNPNLTCIEVDNVSWSVTNWSNIDFTASFSTNCSNNCSFTVIPDPVFEQSLINLGYDVGTLDGLVPTSNIDTITVLNINNKNISDLTGIQDFSALTNLYCDNNQLSNLSLIQNTFLTTLNCKNNQLTSIDITQNPNLTFLSLEHNLLTNLDVTQNTVLVELICDNNQLTLIDLTQNLSLTDLVCDSNQITNLNLIQNTNLINLNCQFNQINTLDLTNNINLINLYCYNNLLTMLNVSQNNSLINLYCHNNLLNNLDVTQNILLKNLYCHNNVLNNLDVTQNHQLENLFCQDNLLSSLIISQNDSLINLYCYNNQISILDASQNNALINFYCNNNQLSNLSLPIFGILDTLFCQSNQLSNLNLFQSLSLTNLNCSLNLLSNLDLTKNALLTYLTCNNNQLTSMNVKNGNNQNITYFNTLNNPLLTCIDVDDLGWSTTNWTNIDIGTSFNTNCSNPTTAQNLVINPSFEYHQRCPATYSEISSQFQQTIVYNWVTPSASTPDYFNACFSPPDTIIMDVPQNEFGYQNARTGAGYVGIICSDPTSFWLGDYQEYVQGVLVSPLVSGTTYSIEFYWSLSDFSKYNTQSIGVSLKSSAQYYTTFYVIPNPSLQQTGIPLIDTNNWVHFKQNYTAQGGEQYIIIGNFYGSIGSYVTNGWGTIDQAYYYIDDVSVTSISTVDIDNLSLQEFDIDIYPNPTKNKLLIRSLLNVQRINILTITGIQLLSFKSELDEIDVSNLANGVYLIHLTTEKGVVTKKFIKQ